MHRLISSNDQTAKVRRKQLIEEYKRTQDPCLREELVEEFSGLVEYLARRFAGHGEPLEDIKQVGYLGLLKAIDRYDPNEGTEFVTFATPTILGEIKRHLRDNTWSMSIPRRIKELALAINRAEAELGAELGRQPTIAEIAKKLNASTEEVLEALEAMPATSTVSLDEVIGKDDDDNGRELHEEVGYDDPNMEIVELKDLIQRAMRHLSPRERQILAMRFYDEMSQAEIAKKLNISQMHVSRLQRAALELLKSYLPKELAEK